MCSSLIVQLDLQYITRTVSDETVYIHFHTWSLGSGPFIEGPKWLRTELTKDRTDSVTSVLGTYLPIKGQIWTSIYEDITYVTALQTVDCVANNHTGQFFSGDAVQCAWYRTFTDAIKNVKTRFFLRTFRTL